MDLYKRILKEQEPFIELHQFQAAIAEILRGKSTVATAQAYFKLNASELTEVQTLVARVQAAGMKSDEVDQILILADTRYPGYDTVAALKARFGII